MTVNINLDRFINNIFMQQTSEIEIYTYHRFS